MAPGEPANLTCCPQTGSLIAVDFTNCALTLGGLESLRCALQVNDTLQQVKLNSNESAFHAFDTFRKAIPDEYVGRRRALKEQSTLRLYMDIQSMLQRNRERHVDSPLDLKSSAVCQAFVLMVFFFCVSDSATRFHASVRLAAAAKTSQFTFSATTREKKTECDRSIKILFLRALRCYLVGC